MYILYVCVCIMYVPSAHGGQKRVLDALELRSQMLVSCYVVLGVKPILHILQEPSLQPFLAFLVFVLFF